MPVPSVGRASRRIGPLGTVCSVNDLPTLTLASGRDKKIRGRYPWVQRGELVGGPTPKNGSVARLLDNEGRFLSVGTYNGASRFPFRVYSLEDEPLDQEFFARRFRQSFALREKLVSDTDSKRVLFAEADGVPGLIVDDYAGHLVVQVRTLGGEKLRDQWLPAMLEVFVPKSIYEKSDMQGREEEGLDMVARPLFGDCPPVVRMQESGLLLDVPVAEGLKTGGYLDQRNSRRLLAAQVKPGDKVLDCFCYTGGFALAASRAGAIAYGVDIHPVAVATARSNAVLNKLEVPFVEANAFDFLTDEAPSLGKFDWIVLDPPAIAKDKAKRDSLKWAIWKLVCRALPVLAPGGRLVVCNCSYQLPLAETIDVCRLAANDVGKPLFLEGVTYQDLDHPAPVTFPESLYLKCVWLRSD
ncbi:MAG: class I SAM-dependent rRNA methyltransferase [Armatimonadetes bacterium]|nr:class I SAM-dependent rRNA methyltransferase [Armatimonadota bacterium]